ncbi:GTP cyclohydrolase I [Paramicrobacterium agarici]|uniref:GTP cyclohydrolase I n=1 Tax=Paramicrobacterium agarici TaxID=630514 RepID=UPI00114ECA87|nr:GTP cyclohydrolase I [Microbacterium agarici]TQO21804.1 GTP cyclohydrolase I [Microbacterium agarici]
MTLTQSVPQSIEQTLPDIDRAAQHAEGFLTALGVDLGTPARRESAMRMAKAYLEMMSSDPFEMTTFDNDEGYGELVLVTGIAVQSLCEHHFLPFTGVAHVGYLPGERLVGLSKLARTVELHARRPQTQENLTQQIADHLVGSLAPRGVGVVIEAEHTCMSLRGVRASSTRTRTSAFTGALRDPAARQEFLASL